MAPRWSFPLLLALGLLLCLVVPPARAAKLVDFTIEIDEEVYQVGEFVGVTYHAYNAGDEDLEFWGDHFFPVAIWVFENAAELSRDDLLSEQEPISSTALPVVYTWYEYGSPLFPGETFTDSSSGPFRDDLGDPIGPGQYTFLGVEGPYPEAWGGATVDYSNAYADVTIVPEPGTLCLLLGAASAGLLRRGKRLGR